MKITATKISADIRPSDGNPRSSEGSFARLSDGRIVFAYSRYNGTSYGDHASCDICAVYSTDGGESFDVSSCTTLVHASDYGVQNVMSVSLLELDGGDIALFYLIKYPDGASSYNMRLFDSTMSSVKRETECLPHRDGCYFVVNNDRVMQTSDGRLVIPAAYHPKFFDSSYDMAFECDSRSVACYFESTDSGKTWRQLPSSLRLPDTYTSTGLQEPGIVELREGIYYTYARTDRAYQYEAVSLDRGAHWFGPQPSQFASPPSPMLIKKNPHSGKFYAIYNPIPRNPYIPSSNNSAAWGRTPLVICESEDGVTFGARVTLEDDDKRGFCYPAMYFVDAKTMLLSYCAGGEEDKITLNRTVIRKLMIE